MLLLVSRCWCFPAQRQNGCLSRRSAAGHRGFGPLKDLGSDSRDPGHPIPFRRQGWDAWRGVREVRLSHRQDDTVRGGLQVAAQKQAEGSSLGGLAERIG